MTLEPLWSATQPIQIHTIAAISAFLIGIIHLAQPRGTPLHRIIGWGWLVLMIVSVFSSFFIHNIRQWGLWSWIHILSMISIVLIPTGVYLARNHAVLPHGTVMTLCFFGLVIAGSLAFWPDRVMYRIFFE